MNLTPTLQYNSVLTRTSKITALEEFILTFSIIFSMQFYFRSGRESDTAVNWKEMADRSPENLSVVK